MKSIYYIALSQLLQTAVAQYASVRVMFGDYNTRQIISSVWLPPLRNSVLWCDFLSNLPAEQQFLGNATCEMV